MTEKALNSQHAGPDGTAPVSAETALESWKEIAAYLKRDVRTVTRWEKLEKLPVHRHRHLARSSVYAYPSELDAWRERRKPEAADLPQRIWWHSVPAFAVVLIFAVSLVSVATGRRVGAASDAGVQAENNPQFRQVHIATAVPNTGGKLSPDGTRLCFAGVSKSTEGDPFPAAIYTIDTRGGGEPKEILTGLIGTPGQIDWSRDAKRLVFEFDKGRGTELWLMTDFQDLRTAEATDIRIQ